MRTNGSPGDFTLLAPRQEVNPTPYASYAPKAGEAAMATDVPNGSITAVKTAAEAVKSTHLAPGAVTSAGIADGAITDADVSSSGISGSKIVGGDLQALRLKVGQNHSLDGQLATIAGGLGNTNRGDWSAIGGGRYNTIQANAHDATIGGGPRANTIQSNSLYSTIAREVTLTPWSLISPRLPAATAISSGPTPTSPRLAAATRTSFTPPSLM